MTRREEHFDAMLRHLGATYYQTMHGSATASDMARALESAEAEDGHGLEHAGSRGVFLRPDEEIAAEVHGVLTGILMAEPDGVAVKVRDGVVTLSGALPRDDLIGVAERLTSAVDGVVTVNCKLTGRSVRTVPPAAC